MRRYRVAVASVVVGSGAVRYVVVVEITLTLVVPVVGVIYASVNRRRAASANVIVKIRRRCRIVTVRTV